MSLDDPDPLRRLLAIMARLRDPELGCPWDRQQTRASLVPYTLEEAYEVADAAVQDDPTILRDELGDLLFQVVFQARLAEEVGAFDFAAVAASIGNKLLRRHPHVFAHAVFTHDREREVAWEAAKAEERRDRDRHSAMDDIPLALPALARALKLQRRAARSGFDWERPEPVLDKIHEEIAEVTAELGQGGDPDRLTAELGDVLFAVANWARHLGVDPETALRASNRRFERRFRIMEDLASGQGQDFAELPLAAQELLWCQAKALENQQD